MRGWAPKSTGPVSLVDDQLREPGHFLQTSAIKLLIAFILCLWKVSSVLGVTQLIIISRFMNV